MGRNYKRVLSSLKSVKGKKKIAILITVCSRGTKINDIAESPLLTKLYLSLMKYNDDNYKCQLLIGYDDDPLYLKDSSKLEEFGFQLYKLSGCQHAPAFAWNQLFKIAIDSPENYDYFLQLGDDLKFNHTFENWIERMIRKLGENDDIGVVGPSDLVNYKQRINGGRSPVIENSMVSRKHFDIFGFFFDPRIKNYYCDDWLTEVYQKRAFIFPDINYSNEIRVGRYQLEAYGIRY